MKEAILQHLSSLPPPLSVFLISTLPIFELRGGIPVGINVYHLPWWETFIFALLGNLFPVPFILYFLRLFHRVPIVKRYLERTKRRGELVEKYEALGLSLFVAIPLPVTGAWTGAALAFLFNIRFPLAMLAITGGVFMAGIIVTVLSLMGVWGAVIAGCALFILLLSWFFRKNLRGAIPILLIFLACTHAPPKEVRIGRIEFEGNKSIPDKELVRIMRSKPGSVYDEWVLRSDIKRIIEYYRSKGFFDARIIERRGKFDERSKKVNFTFVLVEGIRRRIGKVRIEGGLFDEREIKEKIPVKEGEFYDAGKIGLSEYMISELHAEKGYINAEVSLDMEERGIMVDITYRIKEGKPVYVRDVRIEGLSRIKKETAMRDIEVKKGSLFLPSLAYHSQEKLYGRGAFADVHFTLEDLTGDSVTVVFHVKEAKPGWAAFGVGYETPDRLLGSFETGYLNLFGGLQRVLFNLSLSYAFRGEHRLEGGIRYEEPFFLGTGFSFGCGITGKLEKEEEYALRIFSLDSEISRKIGNWNFSGIVKISQAKLDTILEAPSDTFLRTNTIEFQGLRDARDDPIYPSSGYYLFLSGSQAGGWLGGVNHFYRLIFDAGVYKKISSVAVLALRGKTGFTFPMMDPEKITVDSRFELGGIGSIRGYDPGTIGEPDPRGKKSGIELLLFNLELRFEFMRWVLVFFVDTGGLWMDPQDISLNDFKLGTGIAVGWRTPLGPIRIDFGKKLTDVEPGDRGKFYLSFGHPF